MSGGVNWPADFLDAHRRHWDDGEVLFQRRRWANADYLYGFSAECGLKAVMAGIGMGLRPDGSPNERRYRIHIDRLWPEFVSFAQDRQAARYYSSLLAQDNPFADWSVDQRYAHQGQITQAMVESHRAGAGRVHSMLREARKDGVLG